MWSKLREFLGFSIAISLSFGLMFFSDSNRTKFQIASFATITCGIVLSKLLKSFKQPQTSYKNIQNNYILLIATFWAITPAIISATNAYWNGGYDVSLFSQAVYNIILNNVPTTTMAFVVNHYAEHPHLILHVLAWIYSPISSFVPCYLWLIFTQLLTALIAPILVKWLPYSNTNDLESLKKDTLLSWMLLTYFCFWGLSAAQRFEFHPVVLGANFTLAGIVCICKRQRILSIFLITIACFCGEMFLISSPTILGMCAVFNRQKKKESTNLILVLTGFFVGFIFLYIYMSHISPKLFNAGDAYYQVAQRFQELGNSFSDLVTAPFRIPNIFLGVIMNPNKLLYYSRFIPILLVPIILIASRKIEITKDGKADNFHLTFIILLTSVIAISTSMAKIAFSSAATFLDLNTHYAADIMPGLMIAILGISTLTNKVIRGKIVFHLPSYPLIYLIILALDFPGLGLRLDQTWNTVNLAEEQFPDKLRKALRDIPKDRVVYINTFQVSAELSFRKTLLSFYVNDNWMAANQSPDYLILGWPPEHGVTTPKPDSFVQSFKSSPDGSLLLTFKGRNEVYLLQGEFDSRLPGHIWIWKKA